MVGSRTATALVFLAGSLLASVALWVYFDTFLFFLFVPFVPFLFRRGSSSEAEPPVQECPECGFKTRNDDYEYCPRDGRRLRRRENDGTGGGDGRDPW